MSQPSCQSPVGHVSDCALRRVSGKGIGLPHSHLYSALNPNSATVWSYFRRGWQTKQTWVHSHLNKYNDGFSLLFFRVMLFLLELCSLSVEKIRLWKVRLIEWAPQRQATKLLLDGAAKNFLPKVTQGPDLCNLTRGRISFSRMKNIWRVEVRWLAVSRKKTTWSQ